MQVQILMETQENMSVISVPECNASASANACIFAGINILTMTVKQASQMPGGRGVLPYLD